MLRAVGSAFIGDAVSGTGNMGNVQVRGFMLGEHGCLHSSRDLCMSKGAAASLVLGLSIGDRHPSYWQKTVKNALDLLLQCAKWLKLQWYWMFKEKYIKNLKYAWSNQNIERFKEKHTKNLKITELLLGLTLSLIFVPNQVKKCVLMDQIALKEPRIVLRGRYVLLRS